MSDVTATTAGISCADLRRDGLAEEQTLHVERHGLRKLVERVFSGAPSRDAMRAGDPVLHGGADADGIRTLDADDRASDFCLADSVLGSFPKKSGPARLPDGALTAFPTLVRTVDHADDVANVTRDTLTYLGRADGPSDVKLPERMRLRGQRTAVLDRPAHASASRA